MQEIIVTFSKVNAWQYQIALRRAVNKIHLRVTVSDRMTIRKLSALGSINEHETNWN